MHLAFYVHTLLLSHSQLSFSALIVKYVWLSRYKMELFVNKWHFRFVWSVVNSRCRVLISRTRRLVASVSYVHSAFEFWYYWLFSFRTACSLIKLGGYFLKTSEFFIFLRLDLRCSSRFFIRICGAVYAVNCQIAKVVGVMWYIIVALFLIWLLDRFRRKQTRQHTCVQMFVSSCNC